MKLIRCIQSVSSLCKKHVATIGNFDGVHLGHQALLAHLKSEALKQQLPLTVFLFEPQPGEYFLKEAAPPRISTLREKLAALREIGVNYVVCLHFNASLAGMTAEKFAQNYFFSGSEVKYLLIGEDFRFGRERAGDVALLKRLAARQGAEVKIFPSFAIQGQRVSSTLIRQALMSGNFKEAESFLGRSYALCGRVIPGQGLGRQWGIPTANISLPALKRPLSGVYFVQLKRSDGRFHQGVANFGLRPTLGGTHLVLEVHLLQFGESIYGERVEVLFLHKLREECKFASQEALKQQIHKDVQAAKSYFGHVDHSITQLIE